MLSSLNTVLSYYTAQQYMIPGTNSGSPEHRKRRTQFLLTYSELVCHKCNEVANFLHILCTKNLDNLQTSETVLQDII